MESLRRYLKSLTPSQQTEYALRAGTTIGYLRKALSRKERIAESTSIALDRESDGEVPVEDTRPDVDWSYLRGRPKRASVSSLTTTSRNTGCGEDSV